MKFSNQLAFLICRLTVILLFLLGFSLVGLWPGVVLTILVAFSWAIPHNFNHKAFSSFRLIAFAGLAIAGLLNGVSMFLMMAALTASLACWDMEDRSPVSSGSTLIDSCDRFRFSYLVKTCLVGLLIGEICLVFQFHLPFEAMLGIALIVLFNLFLLFLIFSGKSLRKNH